MRVELTLLSAEISDEEFQAMTEGLVQSDLSGFVTHKKSMVIVM
jgi:hypothetical protein